MPLDLANEKGPISLSDPNLQDVLLDLQGNILNGHGRDQAIHIFLQFTAARIEDAKARLAALGKFWITSAAAQLAASEEFKNSGKDAGLFAHVGLSGAGYAALGIAPGKVPAGAALRGRPAELNIGGAQVPFYERDVFAQGMKRRRSALQDPAAELWDSAFREEIHAVVIIADDNNLDLLTAEAHLRRLFETESAEPIARVLSVERGFGLRKRFYDGEGNPKFGENVEHFGYVDGRSQPALLDTQLQADRDRDGTGVWDPTAPPNLVLLQDPNGKPGVGFGSFLVFRKLEQDVQGFKQAQRRLAQETGIPLKLAGALAVGRFEDGTPVVLQPGDDSNPAAPNDFDYSSDKPGLRCPFHAHIRKTNPRGESVDPAGNFARDAEEERGHRIARRGIPYGGGLTAGDEESVQPRSGVGLLFMCYQSDIWEQFEFMQRLWANNDKFLQPGLRGTAEGAPDYLLNTGMDAIIGQQQAQLLDPLTGFTAPPTKWPSEWGKSTVLTTNSIARFVTLKGGEYFFSPCLSFLRKLSSKDMSSDAAYVPPDFSQSKRVGQSQKISA